MNNLAQRKAKTRLIIFKERYLNPKALIKFFALILSVLIIAPILLTWIVYNGYSQKIIHSTSEIREELTTGVLISDGNKDNLKYLTAVAAEAFEQRKLNFLYIYLHGDAQSLDDSDVQKLLEKVPESQMKIERSTKDPYDVCDSTKKVYDLNKTLILSFKDTATRATFICNNLNEFSQGLSPDVDETTISITPTNFLDYVNDVLRVFTGLRLQ